MNLEQQLEVMLWCMKKHEELQIVKLVSRQLRNWNYEINNTRNDSKLLVIGYELRNIIENNK